MSLVCTRMSSVCHSFVLACHPYVTRMYSYVIRMSLVCTCMSSVCHSYILVCHPYVTRMYSHVIHMSLVCGFTMNRNVVLTSKLGSTLLKILLVVCQSLKMMRNPVTAHVDLRWEIRLNTLPLVNVYTAENTVISLSFLVCKFRG